VLPCKSSTGTAGSMTRPRSRPLFVLTFRIHRVSPYLYPFCYFAFIKPRNVRAYTQGAGANCRCQGLGGAVQFESSSVLTDVELRLNTFYRQLLLANIYTGAAIASPGRYEGSASTSRPSPKQNNTMNDAGAVDGGCEQQQTQD